MRASGLAAKRGQSQGQRGRSPSRTSALCTHPTNTDIEVHRNPIEGISCPHTQTWMTLCPGLNHHRVSGPQGAYSHDGGGGSPKGWGRKWSRVASKCTTGPHTGATAYRTWAPFVTNTCSNGGVEGQGEGRRSCCGQDGPANCAVQHQNVSGEWPSPLLVLSPRPDRPDEGRSPSGWGGGGGAVLSWPQDKGHRACYGSPLPLYRWCSDV